MKKVFLSILILCLLFAFVGCNPNDTNNGNVHVHKYSTDFKNDTITHWFECDCGARANIMEHTFGEPFYDDERHAYVSVCTICNARTFLDSHVLNDYYTYDEIAHWKDCHACDVKVYYAEHDMSEPILDVETNQYVSFCLTCPYEKRTVAHTFNKEYHYDENGHWFECTECGEPGNVYSHTFGTRIPGEEPCSSVYKCILCGYETEMTYEHTWDYSNGMFNTESLKTEYKCKINGCDATTEINGLPNIPIEITTIYPDNIPEDMTPEDFIYPTRYYYSYRISMDKTQDGKLILRNTKKTYYPEASLNSTNNLPTNKDDFKYIGTLLPKNVYEIGTLFPMSQTPKISFGTAEFNANDFNQKFFNFIRYLYISTDGKLLLSFEYDTSFIYQTPNLCYSIRGKFVVEECSFDKSPANTLERFLQQTYLGFNDYIEFFSGYSNTVFDVKFLGLNDTTTGLNVGDFSWCDINVEIPLLHTNKDNIFWEYVIANSESGIKDGLYEW